MPLLTPRYFSWLPLDLEPEGLKLYSIHTQPRPVTAEVFLPHLQAIKSDYAHDWQQTAGFAILHQGAAYPYLILAWWGNDNELFTAVSVKTATGWQTDPKRFSFCLYDMAVFTAERQLYMQTYYTEQDDTQQQRNAAYRHSQVRPDCAALVLLEPITQSQVYAV